MKTWLITGGTGALGSHILRELADQTPRNGCHAATPPDTIHEIVRRDDEPTAADQRHVLDLSDLDALQNCVRVVRPDYIIHTAAVTAVSDADNDPARATRVNVDATRTLCAAAAEVGARLIHCSTDLVFDGKGSPYDEESHPTPTTHYGRTKAEAEQVVLTWPKTLVVRLPLLFGYPMSSRATTFTQQIDALREGEPLKLFTDEYRAALWIADAARALIALARSDLTGLIHVSGPARLSRFELIQQCAQVLLWDRFSTGQVWGRLPTGQPNLIPILRSDIPGGDQRPGDVVLSHQRFRTAFPHFQKTPISPPIFDPRYGGR